VPRALERFRSLRLWIEQQFFTGWYLIRDALGKDKLSISQINEQLWCGGAITRDSDVRKVASDGITAIIDCREEFNDRALVRRFNLPPTPPSLRQGDSPLRYCDDGVPDDGRPKPVCWFSTAWDFAQPILDVGGVVLSHCSAGVNRGPSMAYFLLRAHWHMSPTDAFALVKAQRSVALARYHRDADTAITALGLDEPHPGPAA
jgi:hypothetical protein